MCELDAAIDPLPWNMNRQIGEIMTRRGVGLNNE
jgi:hypothetical protein